MQQKNKRAILAPRLEHMHAKPVDAGDEARADASRKRITCERRKLNHFIPFLFVPFSERRAVARGLPPLF